MPFGLEELIGGGKSESKVQDVTPQQLKNLLGPFEDTVMQLFGEKRGNPLAGVPRSQQSRSGYAAPIGAAEQAALGSIASQTGAGTQRAGVIADTLAGKYTNPQSNPFLNAYTQAQQRTTLQGLEDVLGRALPGQFAAAGHSVQPGGSSPFDMAAARATEASANMLSDIASNIGFGAYEAERGRQQQAIQFSQQEIDTSIKNLQAQALPRMIEQYGLDAGLKEFQGRTQSLLSLLGLLSGGTMNQSATTNQQQDTVGIVPGLIQPAAQMAGGYAAGGA